MKTNTKIIQPAIDSVFKFNVNAGKFKAGIIYTIVGFGKGKPNKDGVRREFWTILEKHNTKQPEQYIWKSELKRLFNENKAFHTLIRGY